MMHSVSVLRTKRRRKKTGAMVRSKSLFLGSWANVALYQQMNKERAEVQWIDPVHHDHETNHTNTHLV